MAELLEPYLREHGSERELPVAMYGQLVLYLDLLVRWNARTNLTAVREPEEMVRRHFGESLFAGKVLAGIMGSEGRVLDLGSGAGFPGIPMQVLVPGWRVTLAESQGKKAAFLREAVRVLGLRTEVWSGRVEAMGPDARFDAVVMRAVDRMGAMEEVARGRVKPEGVLLRMTTELREGAERMAMPGTSGSFVEWSRPADWVDVPRGTLV